MFWLPSTIGPLTKPWCGIPIRALHAAASRRAEAMHFQKKGREPRVMAVSRLSEPMNDPEGDHGAASRCTDNDERGSRLGSFAVSSF